MQHQVCSIVRERSPAFVDVKRWYDDHLSAELLDLDDQDVYEAIFHAGKFAATFQFTSPATQKFIQRFKPRSVHDLAVATSIWRPGPLAAKVDRLYVDAKNKAERGELDIQYKHPAIEEVLGPTHGCLIFQEQCMALAHKLAKMPLARCDLLRKAILKRSVSELDKKNKQAQELHDEFIDGCVANGLMKKDADDLYEKIRAFSSYAFNKSLHFAERIDVHDRHGNFLREEEIQHIKPGQFVRSRDESTFTREDVFVKVLALHDHGMQQLVEIELEDRSKVRCTLEHKFRTTDGRMLPLRTIIREDLDIVVKSIRSDLRSKSVSE